MYPHTKRPRFRVLRYIYVHAGNNRAGLSQLYGGDTLALVSMITNLRADGLVERGSRGEEYSLTTSGISLAEQIGELTFEMIPPRKLHEESAAKSVVAHLQQHEDVVFSYNELAAELNLKTYTARNISLQLKRGMLKVPNGKFGGAMGRICYNVPSYLGGIEEGMNVRIEDDERRRFTYVIVDPVEADASQGRISREAPVARALLGRKVGDDVQVNTPGGARYFRVEQVKLGQEMSR